MALTWLAEEPNEAGGGEGVVRHGALLRVRTYIFGVLTAVVEDCEDFDHRDELRSRDDICNWCLEKVRSCRSNDQTRD